MYLWACKCYIKIDLKVCPECIFVIVWRVSPPCTAGLSERKSNWETHSPLLGQQLL